MRRSGRTGCVTCRIRKIKCDETKPSCRKCTSTGRKCDGYSTVPFSRDDFRAAYQSSLHRGPRPNLSPIPNLVSNTTFKGVAEKRYFQFFRHQIVAGTTLLVNSRFWGKLVLQACDAEPAIKHAVLAIAAFNNWSILQADPSSAQDHLTYADRQYQIAFGKAKSLVATPSCHQIDRSLIVCVFFILYESMRGYYANSRLHMDSGMAIVAQSRQSGWEQSHRNHLDEIVEVFAHLDLFALTFSDSVAPYHYTLHDMLQTATNLQLWPFSNINEAQSALTDILRWRLVMSYHITDSSSMALEVEKEHETALAECKVRLSAWREYWNDFLRRHANTVPTSSPLVELIELWYAMAYITINTGPSGPETRYDELEDYFVRLVELGESLSREVNQIPATASFSLELGFIMPTFFCAIRCRHPQIRRRAVQTLRLGARREGPWQSTAAAAIARWWYETEEAGLEQIFLPRDVPESHRIAVLYVQVNSERSFADLRYTKTAAPGVGEKFWTGCMRWGAPNEGSDSCP